MLGIINLNWCINEAIGVNNKFAFNVFHRKLSIEKFI